MGKAALRAVVVMTLGFALGVCTLALTEAMSTPHAHAPMSLAELTAAHDLPMSHCDDAPMDSQSEPLWCADSSSPLCIPALPPAPRLELADGSLAADVHVLVFSAPRRIAVLASWPAITSPDEPARACSERLDRPPRA